MREWRGYVAALVMLDMAGLAAAAASGAWLASRPPLGSADNHPAWLLLPLALPAAWLFFIGQGLYSRQNLLGGTREYEGVVRACTYSFLAVLVLALALHLQLSRAWVGLSWLLSLVCVGGLRFCARRGAYRLRRDGLFTTRLLMVGADADSVSLARQLVSGGGGTRVVGFLDDYIAPGAALLDGVRVLGTSGSLIQVATRTGVDEAIIVPQALPWERLHDLLADVIATPGHFKVHLSAGFHDLLTAGVTLRERSHVPLLEVNRARLRPVESTVKLLLDRLLGTALLVALSPVFVIEYFRLKPKGPVLSRAPVLGRDGRCFEQLSFRARPGQSESLRKMPGLVNVIRGDLSLVGPRPIPVVVGDGDARYASKLSIRPGLTGPWREAKSSEEQPMFDLYYIRGYSIWLDLHVLFGRFLAHLPHSRRSTRGARGERSVQAQ